MRHYFEFGGKSSRDFSVYISNGAQFDAPRRDVEVIDIPGRNGTLSIDNGRFNNAAHRYEVYIQQDVEKNAEAMRAYLMQSSGYKVLRDTLRPEEFYIARYVEEVTIDSSDHVGAAFSLIFDRMPQRFMTAGSAPLPEITGDTTIYNRYMYAAKPLIKAYGTGVLAIGGTRIQITAADTYTDIDCDIEEAYKDDLNNSRNGYVILPDSKFPVLEPGENAVKLAGITRLDIIPRWWTI